MKKRASPGQMAEIAAILAHNPRGHDIAQAVIEREERVLNAVEPVAVITLHGITPPPGSHIHVVHVLVDESRPWDAAVNGCGPNTGADWDIRKVGDQYPPKPGATPKMKVVYLINFGKNTIGDNNIAWGNGQKLFPASPRAVFAIAEHNPDLDKTLGMEGCMAVLSLKESAFGGSRRAPYAWWSDSERKAGLDSFGAVWIGRNWFAFSREE